MPWVAVCLLATTPVEWLCLCVFTPSPLPDIPPFPFHTTSSCAAMRAAQGSYLCK